MPDIVLHLAVSALYGGLALHFWRTRWRASAPAITGMASWERAALLLPILLHSWLLHQDLIAPAQLRFGFGQALSVMLLLGVAIYWVESLFYSLEGMQPLVLPVAALAAPLPALFPGLAVTHTASLEFRLHLILGMAAYSVFTIAMLHALLMALAERSLHKSRKATAGDAVRGGGPLSGPLAGLPPLLTLERLLFHLIAMAFVLLTLTLATGILFSESLFGRALRFDHKTLFALLSWLAFAILLVGRYAWGWRGRMALRFTLIGFIMLLLAYVGSRFVLEVVLGRA